jgi:hypothetical protein
MSVVDEKARRNMPGTDMLIARIAQFSGVTVEEVRTRFLDGTLGEALSKRIVDALMSWMKESTFLPICRHLHTD